MIAEDSLILGGTTYWAIPFNKGIPNGCQCCLPTLGQKVWLDNPGTESSLWGVMGDLLNFTGQHGIS